MLLDVAENIDIEDAEIRLLDARIAGELVLDDPLADRVELLARDGTRWEINQSPFAECDGELRLGDAVEIGVYGTGRGTATVWELARAGRIP